MKRILLVTLSALLCTSLAACSGISANKDDTKTQQTRRDSGNVW